jgi:hypothetical protein
VQQQPGHREYELRGWAWALAWAELAFSLGIEPRAHKLQDGIAEPTIAPEREPDARSLQPAGTPGQVAELWIEGDYIVWHRTHAELAFKVHYQWTRYPLISLMWPIRGWKLSMWSFDVREAQAIPDEEVG